MTLRRVTVATKGDGYTSVEAWVHGEWAAHHRIVGRGWTVTYLPSGRTCTSKMLAEAAARSLASWLDSHVTRDELLDWSNPSAETVARIYEGIQTVAKEAA